MQKSIDDIQVTIPSRLEEAVEAGLKEVTRCHRKKLLVRAGASCGTFVVLVASLLVLGFANPAVAAQIPFIGGLFQQVAGNNKISIGNQNVGGYDVVEQIQAQDTTANGPCTLTVEEGYSDGKRLQLVLKLDTPEDFFERYDSIAADAYHAGITINGESGKMKLSPFSRNMGHWESFGEMVLPESQQTAEFLELTLSVNDLVAREKMDPQKQYSEENPIPTVALTDIFSIDFQVHVDTANEFSFSCEAEDNGAQIHGISGTPIETVISITKPFWGNVSSVPEDGTLGKPSLLTMDGKEVQMLYSDSMERGGYDYGAQDSKTSDLYFDGLPAGTKKVVLRFNKNDWERKEVLAEFIFDLEQQTVSPSTTYQEEGPLALSNPYRYESVQNGAPGEMKNGYALQHLYFGWEGEELRGSFNLQIPDPGLSSGYRFEVLDAYGVPLCSVSGELSENLDFNVREDQSEWRLQKYSPETDWIMPQGSQELSVSVILDPGTQVAMGSQITLRAYDLATDDLLFSENRVLDTVHY